MSFYRTELLIPSVTKSIVSTHRITVFRWEVADFGELMGAAEPGLRKLPALHPGTCVAAAAELLAPARSREGQALLVSRGG